MTSSMVGNSDLKTGWMGGIIRGCITCSGSSGRRGGGGGGGLLVGRLHRDIPPLFRIVPIEAIACVDGIQRHLLNWSRTNAVLRQVRRHGPRGAERRHGLRTDGEA